MCLEWKECKLCRMYQSVSSISSVGNSLPSNHTSIEYIIVLNQNYFVHIIHFFFFLARHIIQLHAVSM